MTTKHPHPKPGTDLTVIPTPDLPVPSWMTDTEPPETAPFASLYAWRYGHEDRAVWQQFWDEAEERWLTSGRRRSDHTRRSYRHALTEWRAYILREHNIVHLWQITDRTVQAWITAMQAQGLKANTIGQRLAAVSSYYDYCSGTSAIMRGREITLFIDAWGSTRLNPFVAKTIERPQVPLFSGATAVPRDAYNWTIEDLRRRAYAHPDNGDVRRNLALMLAFGFLGWRNAEVIGMTWGKLSENPEAKGYVYLWTGKARNGEEEKRAVPVGVVNAIIDYLQADGRWNPGGDEHIRADDYIWQPRRTHGTSNFANVDGLQINRHISQSTANSILKSLLRRYYKEVARDNGMNTKAARAYAAEKAADYSIHSLRHMFARQLYVASGNDLNRVSKKLGHKSLATTQVYMDNLAAPVDDFSEILAIQLGVNLER